MYSDMHQCAAASARLKNIPALATFHQVVTEKVASCRDDAFWDCEDEFSAILSPQFITAVVNHELQSLAADPLYVPEEASAYAIALVHTPQYSLEIWVMPPDTAPPPFVRSSPVHCMFGMISAGPATVELFRQPKPLPNDIFDRDRPLLRAGQMQLSQGKFTRIRAGHDLFLLQPVAAEQAYLFFRSRLMLRLMWEYSTRTLQPEKIIAADPSSSRLQYAARLLSAMSCSEAIPNLFGLMQHPDHFVRWAAVQSIVALDLQKGLEALALAQKDEHSHIKNAAAKAMRLATDMEQSAAGSAD